MSSALYAVGGDLDTGKELVRISRITQTRALTDYQSLFGNLVPREDRFAGQQPARTKDSKASYRTSRLVSRSSAFSLFHSTNITLQNTAETATLECYAPYAFVRDRNIKAHLCHIAKLFQYIDSGFAEYFQVVISRLPRHTVEEHLESAHSKVAKRQARSQPQGRTDSSLHLGDLGNF